MTTRGGVELAQAGETPDDLITTPRATKLFQTSRRTIERDIKVGRLTDYRKAGAPTNAKHLLSEAQLDKLYERYPDSK
jgi:hypothetical protein